MKSALLSVFLASLIVSLSSCVSQDEALRRLAPPRSLADIQLSDIEALLPAESEAALHAIGRFSRRYLGDTDDESRREALLVLEQRARTVLREAQQKAADEGDWDRALSLLRSLSAVEDIPLAVHSHALLVQAARDDLSKGAFLSASLRARAALSLSVLPDDLLRALFEEAAKRRERATALWFLTLLESSSPGKGEDLDAKLVAWAREREDPADMVEGVATVWVDRGLKIEQGTASLDRVIGSAFFISSDGLMVTNHHVIESLVDPEYEGYARLYIRMGSSTSPRIPAKVIGWDPLMDLALIQAQVSPSFTFSCLDTVPLEVGAQILAIGSPAGLEKTVTRGIVSATGRRLLQSGDVFQLDAAVNQGNSGGPAVDLEGRLAGVVFAGVPSFQGLNFAVPASRLADALPALLAGGKVSRPWLGIALNESARGLECVYTTPGSPAASQTLPEGHFLAKLAGKRIEGGSTLVQAQDLLFVRRPGELVPLELGDGSRFVLALDARPELPLEEVSRLDSRERTLIPLLGLVLSWARSGLFSPEYQVTRVLPGSIAEEAGISELDSLVINGYTRDPALGYGVVDLRVKRRKAGYLEASIRIPVSLSSGDFL